MAKKAAPSFDPLQTALDVRTGKTKLATLLPEQQIAVRGALKHTGKLRTQLLRRANGTLEPTTIPPTSRFRQAFSS